MTSVHFSAPVSSSPLYDDLQRHLETHRNKQITAAYQSIEKVKETLKGHISELEIEKGYSCVAQIKGHYKKLCTITKAEIETWKKMKTDSGSDTKKVAEAASQFFKDFKAQLDEKERLFIYLLDQYANLGKAYEMFFFTKPST